MAEEKFISKFDGTTENKLLDIINQNQGVFPFDSELNEQSQHGLTNAAIAKEINAIKDATSNNKGYFLTEEALKAVYPIANEGSKAYVGENYPYKIYLFQNGLWVYANQTGGNENFSAGEFYTKTQIDQQHEAINNEIARVEKGANYEVLQYEVNIATTRLKVSEGNRKGGYMITYNPGTGWIKEQYIGTAVTNEEWIKEENWKAEVLDENIQAIAENAQQQADLAATNAALAEEKATEAATQAAYAKEQGDRLSSIDLSLYRVVIELPSIPEMSEDDQNKIYLKVSAKQGENNKYDEFVVVDGIWELLGQYEAAIDLTAYYKKNEDINTDKKIISRDTIVGNKFATTNNAAAFTLAKKRTNAFGIGCKEDAPDNQIYSGACDLNTGEWKEEPDNIQWTHKGDFFCRSVETEYTSKSTGEYDIGYSNFYCRKGMEVPKGGYRYVLGWYDRGQDGYTTGCGIGSYRQGNGGGWGSMLFEVCQYESSKFSRRAQMELKGVNNNLWISGTLEQNSDERLKENIRPVIDEATTLIDKEIRLVQFDWKDNGKHSYGVIAQEVEKNYPELVYENKDGLKSVSYSEILVIKIAQLENKLKQLENELKTYIG